MTYSLELLAAKFPEPATPEASEKEWNSSWQEIENNYSQNTDFLTLEEARGAAILILETCFPKLISVATIRHEGKILLMSADGVLTEY